MSKTDVSAWLRSETPQHLELLTKLRERITESLKIDLNDNGTPERDWCRAYGVYQKGYQGLLVEERERGKLAILLKKLGGDQLTDEEYEREIRELGLEAVQALPEAELQSELARRGIAIAPVSEPNDD